MYKDVTPMLLVEDAAAAWYGETLGARVRHRHPAASPYEWVSLSLGGVEIMLARKDAARRWYTAALSVAAAPANVAVYLYVEDATALYEQVKGKARILMAPVDQFYGVREFAVRDPFGFVLVFAQELGEWCAGNHRGPDVAQ